LTQWEVVAAILVITVLCVLTIRQHEAWLSEVGLFKRAAGQEPGLGRVQMLLGKAYQAEGDFSSAIAAYSKARERMMEYQQRAFGSSAQQFYKFFRKDINRGLATSHQALQNYDLAEKYFQEALELMPDDAASHNDFGVLYTVTQQNDLAAIEFGRALALRPDDELFIKNYALALAITGHKDQAQALLKEKMSKNPTEGLSALLQQIEAAP
jgi:Flp pilus assembly protein TadD